MGTLMLRNMRHYLAITFIAAVLVSCSSGDAGTESRHTSPDVEKAPWQLSYETYDAAEDSCPDLNCTFIEVSIPILKGGSDLARTNINATIDSLSRELLKGQLPEPLGNASYQTLCESFVDGFQLFQMEFPDSEQSWSYLMSSETSFLGTDYFTLMMTIESYLGGAHPNTQQIAKSFDLESGNEIDVVSRFDDQQMRMLAEQYFRVYHNIDDTTPLNDGGFLFEDGAFSLPENIALSDSGVVMIYNTYEVASYAEGGTSFVLPYDVLTEK